MYSDCYKTKKARNKVEETVNLLKIISEENRLKILCILQKQEMCVCEMWKLLDLPQNLVSYHLKLLKESGLINARKEGAKIFYFSNQKNIKKFTFLISHILSN